MGVNFVYSNERSTYKDHKKHIMDEPQDDMHRTQVYSLKNIMAALSSMKQQAGAPKGDSAAGELRLVIRGVVERYKLTSNFLLVMGRASPTNSEQPGLDLNPHQGGERGVSRWHAMMYMEDGNLYIKDLGSTNGTYVSGKRLEPNIPTKFKKGDDLVLGKLPIQVLFRLTD